MKTRAFLYTRELSLCSTPIQPQGRQLRGQLHDRRSFVLTTNPSSNLPLLAAEVICNPTEPPLATRSSRIPANHDIN